MNKKAVSISVQNPQTQIVDAFFTAQKCIILLIDFSSKNSVLPLS